MDYLENLYRAKYHYSIAERMFENYELFPDKMLIVGVINESAKSASEILKSYLIKEGISGNLMHFRKISGKYMREKSYESLFKLLEIQKAQKTTPVEFKKNDRIIFLVEGKYKILLISRLKELFSNLGEVIKNFD
jgi:hypothetical protein